MTSEHEVHIVVPRAPHPPHLGVFCSAGFSVKECIAIPSGLRQSIFTKHCQSAVAANRYFRWAVEVVDMTPNEPALVEWERVRSRHRLPNTASAVAASARAPRLGGVSLKDFGCKGVRGRSKSADVHVKLARSAIADNVLIQMADLGLMIIEARPVDEPAPYIVFGSQFQGPRWIQWVDVAALVLGHFVAYELNAASTIKIESVVAFHLTRCHDDIPLAFGPPGTAGR